MTAPRSNGAPAPGLHEVVLLGARGLARLARREVVVALPPGSPLLHTHHLPRNQNVEYACRAGKGSHTVCRGCMWVLGWKALLWKPCTHGMLPLMLRIQRGMRDGACTASVKSRAYLLGFAHAVSCLGAQCYSKRMQLVGLVQPRRMQRVT